uniref:Protein kinase domain-containing protein n=1 Tax=Parascaris equorum TaxID=6256 RepID=A0A914RYJ9_PAREQ
MAPELLAAKPRYKCEVDMWALGAVLFTCICGYPPFSNDYSDMPLREQILKVVVFQCGMVRRLVAAEAIRDPWFNDPIVEKAKEVVRSYAVSFCAQVVKEN